MSEENLCIGLIHGDEEALLQVLITGGGFDLVVHGHTPRAGISRRGRTGVINPGEVCGYLTGKATVATFDTRTGETEIHTL